LHNYICAFCIFKSYSQYLRNHVSCEGWLRNTCHMCTKYHISFVCHDKSMIIKAHGKYIRVKMKFTVCLVKDLLGISWQPIFMNFHSENEETLDYYNRTRDKHLLYIGWGGSTHAPVCTWNNARKGTWGLLPPIS
jgi:hypothetical protein